MIATHNQTSSYMHDTYVHTYTHRQNMYSLYTFIILNHYHPQSPSSSVTIILNHHHPQSPSFSITITLSHYHLVLNRHHPILNHHHPQSPSSYPQSPSSSITIILNHKYIPNDRAASGPAPNSWKRGPFSSSASNGLYDRMEGKCTSAVRNTTFLTFLSTMSVVV